MNTWDSCVDHLVQVLLCKDTFLARSKDSRSVKLVEDSVSHEYVYVHCIEYWRRIGVIPIHSIWCECIGRCYCPPHLPSVVSGLLCVLLHPEEAHPESGGRIGSKQRNGLLWSASEWGAL